MQLGRHEEEGGRGALSPCAVARSRPYRGRRLHEVGQRWLHHLHRRSRNLPPRCRAARGRGGGVRQCRPQQHSQPADALHRVSACMMLLLRGSWRVLQQRAAAAAGSASGGGAHPSAAPPWPPGAAPAATPPPRAPSAVAGGAGRAGGRHQPRGAGGKCRRKAEPGVCTDARSGHACLHSNRLSCRAAGPASLDSPPPPAPAWPSAPQGPCRQSSAPAWLALPTPGPPPQTSSPRRHAPEHPGRQRWSARCGGRQGRRELTGRVGASGGGSSQPGMATGLGALIWCSSQGTALQATTPAVHSNQAEGARKRGQAGRPPAPALTPAC